MKDIKQFICESSNKNYKKELDELLKEKNLNGDDEIWSLWRNLKKGEIYLYNTKEYFNLLELWKKSKLYPEENGRYLSFQLSKESAINVCNTKPFKKLKLIDKTK